MEPLRNIRWKQRFENFERSYHTIEKYVQMQLKTELERAGLIQLFEITFELAWKVLKDYLEEEGFDVKSPREAIKTAFQAGIIEEGHIWIDALSQRNLTTRTYDESVVEKLVQNIGDVYFPEIQKLYEKLKKEL